MLICIFVFRCVALWMYALELQQNHLDPFSTMTQSSLYSFAELFSFMLAEQKEREESEAAGRGWVEVVWLIDHRLYWFVTNDLIGCQDCVYILHVIFVHRVLFRNQPSVAAPSEARFEPSHPLNDPAANSDLAQRAAVQRTPNIRVKVKPYMPTIHCIIFIKRAKIFGSLPCHEEYLERFYIWRIVMNFDMH